MLKKNSEKFEQPDTDIKEFLEEKVVQYNSPEYIGLDPVAIPHKYTLKEDIEISGFLAATISWGNRKSIIKSAEKMMNIMGNSPYDFVISHTEHSLDKFNGFIHRTFNETDVKYFIRALKNIYLQHSGIENVFCQYAEPGTLQPAIHHFKKLFFSIPHPARTTKHIADPFKGSSAKRINMYLRWMARKDNKGFDLGVWNDIHPYQLSCPLDVHTGNVARKLGLLTRKQNDAKAVEELDRALRSMDPDDPVKYDFALFGLGVYEGF